MAREVSTADRNRQVYDLVVNEGRQLAWVAKQYGISVSRVHQIVTRGRQTTDKSPLLKLLSPVEQHWYNQTDELIHKATSQALLLADTLKEVCLAQQTLSQLWADRVAAERDERSMSYVIGIDGLVKVWTPDAERITGYSAAEQIGAEPLGVTQQGLTFGLTGGIDSAERRAHYRTLIGQIANSGESIVVDSWRICADGTRKLFRFHATPLKDKTGVVQAISVVATDITTEES